MLLDIATKESNVDSEKSVDLYLLNKAEEMGKQIVSLESEEVQSEIFSSFTLETQVQTLKKNVRHFKNLPKETNKADWLNRNYEALKKIRKDYEEAGINKEYFEQLNDRRNLKMSKKLDQTIQLIKIRHSLSLWVHFMSFLNQVSLHY